MYPNIQSSNIYNSKDTEATQVLNKRWMNKVKKWYIYTMEYYAAIKKNKLMPFAAAQIDLENITLSEISQRKTNIVLYHLHVESKKCYK